MEKYMLSENISQISLFITEKCNLKCKYCLLKNSGNDMKWETAKRHIDLLNSSKSKTKRICLTGGEPLLNFGIVKKITNYCNSLSSSIELLITTNGLLLNKEIFNFLKENRVRILLSLDGRKALNDRNRVFPGGKGTFGKIFSNLAKLNPRKDDFVVNLSVAPKSAKWLYSNFVFLFRAGFRNFQVNRIIGFKWEKEELADFYRSYIKLVHLHNRKKIILDIMANAKKMKKMKKKCPLEFILQVYPDGEYGTCSFLNRDVYLELPPEKIEKVRKKILFCLNNEISPAACKKCIKSHEYCGNVCEGIITSLERKMSEEFEEIVNKNV